MIIAGIARLGKDAVVRYTTGGDPVSNLSLAFNYGRKGDDGKRPSQWIDASLWGERAVKLNEYLTKGTALDVVIEDPHIEEFPRDDGSKGHKLAGRVLLIEFAGGGKPVSETPQKEQKPAATAGGSFNDFEDDIPF